MQIVWALVIAVEAVGMVCTTIAGQYELTRFCALMIMLCSIMQRLEDRR